MAQRSTDGTRKPAPAHVTERSVELPWSAPKPGQEDIRAPELVHRVMASPNYTRADMDTSFLNRDDMRGTRLLLDYQKAETLLEDHGVAHSIVVFGATRIGEPARAEAKAARKAVQPESS